MWEDWRKEEGIGGKEDSFGENRRSSASSSYATRLSSADVVLCSLERLADGGGSGATADVRVARLVRWSQVMISRVNGW